MQVGAILKDDGSITPRAVPEEERIKENLSEGERVLSFSGEDLKLLRERFSFSKWRQSRNVFQPFVNQDPHLQCMIITRDTGYRAPSYQSKSYIHTVDWSSCILWTDSNV